jgi:hypothetical protein
LGGGIVVIDGKLVVIDRLGSVFEFAQGSLRPLNYGTPPSNLNEFVLTAPEFLNPKYFRARSMAYEPSAGVLYVSHERFNPETLSCRRFC